MDYYGYRALSWPWASVDGEVTLVRQYRFDDPKSKLLAKVDSHEHGLALASAPFGSLTSVHIVMTAAIRSFSELREFRPVDMTFWR